MFGLNRYGINYKKDTNEQRVLKVLDYYDGKEVNVWKLINHSKVCHYTEAISRLRKLGYKIENRVEQKEKVRHSYYKLTY